MKTDPEKIDRINRAQILSDLFHLGRSELINQSLFFDTISYLKKEKSPMPFEIFFSSLPFLSDMIKSDSNSYELFKVFYPKKIFSCFNYLINLIMIEHVD